MAVFLPYLVGGKSFRCWQGLQETPDMKIPGSRVWFYRRYRDQFTTQDNRYLSGDLLVTLFPGSTLQERRTTNCKQRQSIFLSLIHISEPTRLGMISYAV